MLSGFRSRWTTSARCAAASVRAPLRRRCARLSPARNSSTMYGVPDGKVWKSSTSMMLGCPMREAISASRRKRASDSAPQDPGAPAGPPRSLCNLGFALVLAAATPARAETVAAEDAVDVTADKPKMVVLSDGKKHYVAIVPFAEDSFAGFFYGDGKVFHQQRVYGGGSVGKESFDKVFWDPRAHAPYQ